MSTAPDQEETWSVMVKPLVAKCEVAAKFGGRAVWNAKGAEALGQLLEAMASKLDYATRVFIAHGIPLNGSGTDDDHG